MKYFACQTWISAPWSDPTTTSMPSSPPAGDGCRASEYSTRTSETTNRSHVPGAPSTPAQSSIEVNLIRAATRPSTGTSPATRPPRDAACWGSVGAVGTPTADARSNTGTKAAR